MRKSFRKLNWFYLPAVCIIAFFVIKPFIETVYISLCNWNGYSGTKIFVGFENYLAMFSDAKFKKSVINTFIYCFGCTIIQNILALLVAMFVNTRFRGNTIVRVVVYLPMMISGLVMGYMMYFFFTYDNGVLNNMLAWFGQEPVDWLSNPKIAVAAILIVLIWQTAGDIMLIYLAGLQGISRDYIEVARLEGANAFQRFRYVTYPLLMPAFSTCVTMCLIGGMKVFGLVISLTGGGPNHASHSIVSYLNRQYFAVEKAGYSSAIGLSLFLFIMIISFVCNKYFEKKMVDL